MGTTLSKAGYVGLTRKAVSIARSLEPDRYFAVELAMGVRADTSRHLAAEAAPTQLPPKPISTLGANLFLRWKEWRTGAD